MYGGDTATFEVDEEATFEREGDPGDGEEREFLDDQDECEDAVEETTLEEDVLTGGRWRQAFNSTAAYLREVDKHKLLTREEERVLLEKYLATEDADAWEQLVMRNQRLVIKAAKPYAQRWGIPLLSVVQDGNIGLMCAIRRFSLEKENRLATYALWWIEQFIERTIMETYRTIRLPIHIQEDLWKAKIVWQRLFIARGHEPTPQEVCTEAGLKLERLKDIEGMVMRMVSIDRPLLGEDGNTTFGEMIHDEEAVLQDERMYDEELRTKVIMPALQKLCLRHQVVLIMRMGIQGIIFSVDEVVEAMRNKNLSLERSEVEQLDASAVQKLALPAEGSCDWRVAERWTQTSSRERLTPQEDVVFALRHGIGMREHSLEEIAVRMNVTREYVRQIEEKAIKRMRTHLEYGVLRNERRQGIRLELL